MRKLLLVISLFTLSFTFTSAQVYYPLPDSGAVWTVFGEYQSSPTDYHAWNDVFTSGGDTIIGSYTYKKLIGTDGTRGGYRNDSATHKVYFAGHAMWNDYTDTLLYDFNLQTGDTAYYESGNGMWITVTGVDSVLIQGQYHKRIKLSNWSGEEWVEGVGSLSTPIGPFTFEFEWNNTLNCLQYNNVLVYQRGMFPTNCNAWHGWVQPWCGLMEIPEERNNDLSVTVLYPENSAPQLHFNKVNGEIEIQLFDAMGKLMSDDRTDSEFFELNSSLAEGIYFARIISQNGDGITEKILVK